MAIKYFVNEEKKQVIGVLSNCRFDAVRKINKILKTTDFCFCHREKYEMPTEFRAVVQCDERDEFNAEVGKGIAKKRILDRYYKALDKRVDKFREDLLILNGKIFETPCVEENTP